MTDCQPDCDCHSRVSESKIHVEGTELEERYLQNT